jgi:hypothetical protein
MEMKEPIVKYNLTEEEEKKEILRQYRGLLKELKPKLKWPWMPIRPCAVKVVSLISFTP